MGILHVVDPAVGGNIPSEIQISCKLYHSLTATVDIVLLMDDMRSKLNGSGNATPSLVSSISSLHRIYLVMYGKKMGGIAFCLRI